MLHFILSKSNTSSTPKGLLLPTNRSVCKTHCGLRSLAHRFSNVAHFPREQLEKNIQGCSHPKHISVHIPLSSLWMKGLYGFLKQLWTIYIYKTDVT